MRRQSAASVLIAVACGIMASHGSPLIVYEGFQYGGGEPLEGQPNGGSEVDATGLAGTWSIDTSGADWKIQPGSLTFGDLATASNHVSILNSYQDRDINSRSLTGDARTDIGNAGEIWFSVLAKPELNGQWDAGREGLALANQALANEIITLNGGGGLAGFGIGSEKDGNEFQPYVWDGTNKITGTAANSELHTLTGNTYLLVGHISFDSGAGGSDVYKLYSHEVNGGVIDGSALTQIGDTLEADVDQSKLSTVTLTRRRSVAYDELRIGTTLEAVLVLEPAPPPSGVVLSVN